MSSKRDVPGDALGVQEPRIRVVPPYVSSSGVEALELCELAGLFLDPWQRLALTDLLGEREDGRWACYEFGLVVSRQNGKGSLLEARELAGLFLLGEKLLVHSAHEQATSSEHFRRLLNLIEGVPEFERRVMKAPKGKGAEAIELRGGQRIFFKTRTMDGGRGLTGDFVALDEAMKLRQATMAALVPTMAARSVTGNPQLVYAGSAVDAEKDEHGEVLSRVRWRALKGESPRLGYHEYSAYIGDPLEDDPAKVTPKVLRNVRHQREANPGFGTRISAEYIDDEIGALDPRSSAVERFGVGKWFDPTVDSSRVVGRELWASLGEAGGIVSDWAFCVDVNPERSWGSIGVAGRREDDLWQFGVVEHLPRTDWIVERCVKLHEEIPSAPFFVLAGSHAANLVAELEAKGLRVVLVDGSDYGIACADWFDSVDRREARYPPPQPDLDEALAGARRGSQIERAWTWSRKASTSPDISPLVAVTVALWGARSGESEYTNVMYGSDQVREDEAELELVGAQAPTFLTQEDTTSCFACRVGGCTIHGG